MYKHTLRKQAHVISTQKMCKLNNSKRRERKRERRGESELKVADLPTAYAAAAADAVRCRCNCQCERDSRCDLSFLKVRSRARNVPAACCVFLPTVVIVFVVSASFFFCRFYCYLAVCGR